MPREEYSSSADCLALVSWSWTALGRPWALDTTLEHADLSWSLRPRTMERARHSNCCEQKAEREIQYIWMINVGMLNDKWLCNYNIPILYNSRPFLRARWFPYPIPILMTQCNGTPVPHEPAPKMLPLNNCWISGLFFCSHPYHAWMISWTLLFIRAQAWNVRRPYWNERNYLNSIPSHFVL